MTNADELDRRPRNAAAPRREPSPVGISALMTSDYRSAFGANAGYEPEEHEARVMGDLLAASIEWELMQRWRRTKGNR